MKNFENMKEIFQKYKCPSNCASDPPKVNVELWKVLSSWQKKSDIKFVSTLLPSKFAPFIFRSLYISLPLIFAPP